MTLSETSSPSQKKKVEEDPQLTELGLMSLLHTTALLLRCYAAAALLLRCCLLLLRCHMLPLRCCSVAACCRKLLRCRALPRAVAALSRSAAALLHAAAPQVGLETDRKLTVGWQCSPQGQLATPQ